MNKKIFFVFLFALIIRFVALNQSLWLDEAVTAKVVMTYKFSEIVSKFSPTDFHPPLYYLFMKLWTNIFGYSEIALRAPSVLFSLLAGWLIYKIARTGRNYGEPLWAASFFLFNPLIIYYSQEARMYMMAAFLLTAGYYYFNKLTHIKNDSKKVKNLLLMNLFFILSFLTFYGSIFFIAGIFIYLLYKKLYKEFFASGFLFLVTFVVTAPLLYQQFMNSKTALINVSNWSLVLGKANIKNLLLIPVKFSIGRISFYPKIAYWIISGLWSIWVFRKIIVGGIKNKQLLFLFIFPLILGFLISFFVPMLQYFRFMYLIIIMSLLLSRSSKHGWILITGFLIFSLVYLLSPAFHREDWKSLVGSLPKNTAVYMITSSSDPVAYYDKYLMVKELRSVSKEIKEKEIIVIPYTTEIHGLDYKTLLGNRGYKLMKEYDFREVTYEKWAITK